MNTNALKLYLLQQLLAIEDTVTLRRVQKLFKELDLHDPEDTSPSERGGSVSESAVSYGISEEELAELHEIERKQVSGEDEYVSMEDAIRLAREALK